MPVGEPRRAPAGRRAPQGGGVVLEPGQPPRAVEPDAAQEADLADGRADVRRSRAPAASTSSTSPAGASRPDGDEHDRADVADAEHAQASVCHAARAQRARAPGAYQRSHAARRSRDQRRPDAGDAHLLAGRRGGRRARTGGGPGGCAGAARSSAARSTPGRQVDVKHGRQREHASSTSTGWIDTSSTTVTPSRRIQPQRREQRHVHVVEHEDLVAQHRQPVEIVGPLLVLDRRAPTPAAARRAPRARSSPGRGSAAARGC